jgi:hypothetical protein
LPFDELPFNVLKFNDLLFDDLPFDELPFDEYTLYQWHLKVDLHKTRQRPTQLILILIWPDAVAELDAS